MFSSFGALVVITTFIGTSHSFSSGTSSITSRHAPLRLSRQWWDVQRQSTSEQIWDAPTAKLGDTGHPHLIMLCQCRFANKERMSARCRPTADLAQHTGQVFRGSCQFRAVSF